MLIKQVDVNISETMGLLLLSIIGIEKVTLIFIGKYVLFINLILQQDINIDLVHGYGTTIAKMTMKK